MINHEVAYTRGIVPGEYVVNVHGYRFDQNKPPPVEVHAVVSIKQDRPEGPFVAPVLGTTAQLNHLGQELTVFRFRLDEDGRIVPGSVSSLFKPLRDYRPK